MDDGNPTRPYDPEPHDVPTAPQIEDEQHVLEPTIGATEVTITPAGTATLQLPAAGYKLGRTIGRGGMGEVVAAHDERIGRGVAIKRMRNPKPNKEALARFLREARIQARLDHPAIVPVHELGIDGQGRPYFTMKRCAGVTLSKLLADGGSFHRMLRAFVDVCLAIDFAHSRGVVHRDLKPANIMLGDYGEVYVLDWGVARVLAEQEAASDPIQPAEETPDPEDSTKSGALLGTPGYIAPEQIMGTPAATPADVYALGCILFEILACEPLHPRGQNAIGRTLSNPQDSPSRRRPERNLPPELDAACFAALADEPTVRPSARELADRVQAYLDGDRDLERRRSLAAQHVSEAMDLLGGGDPEARLRALRSAGRAVALDPESQDATELLARLLVEPPAELPPQLASELARNDETTSRRHSRRAVVPFLCFFMVAPVMPYLNVVGWGWLAIITLGVLATAALSYVNAKLRYVSPWWLLAVQLALVVAFSRFEGPLVLTPVLIAGMLVGMTAIGRFRGRSWLVYAWVLLATLLPMALEYTGVLARTFDVGAAGVLSYGRVFGARTLANEVALIAGNSALLLVVAGYAIATESDRRTAQRELFVQAWQLRQLLPRPAGGTIGE